jgi:hypothetical protein
MWCRIDRPTIRPHEVVAAVPMTLHSKAAFVYEPMMGRAKDQQIF